jgi:hypothetical protein
MGLVLPSGWGADRSGGEKPGANTTSVKGSNGQSASWPTTQLGQQIRCAAKRYFAFLQEFFEYRNAGRGVAGLAFGHRVSGNAAAVAQPVGDRLTLGWNRNMEHTYGLMQFT